MYALLLLVIFVPLFWLMIIRPQQVRQRAHRALVASLGPGDRVETFSGIRGTLVSLGDRTVRLEVAPGVVVTMARLAVADRVADDDLEDDLEDQVTDRSADEPTEPGPEAAS